MNKRDARKWISQTYGIAGLCLVLLAIFEALGLATPALRGVLIGGIVLAGTIGWLVQARQECPRCGARYGYRFRIVNANICRKCGHELPNWRTASDDSETGARS